MGLNHLYIHRSGCGVGVVPELVIRPRGNGDGQVCGREGSGAENKGSEWVDDDCVNACAY